MFNEILEKVKAAGTVITDIVTIKTRGQSPTAPLNDAESSEMYHKLR